VAGGPGVSIPLLLGAVLTVVAFGVAGLRPAAGRRAAGADPR
jgi:hypothetical protein